MNEERRKYKPQINWLSYEKDDSGSYEHWKALALTDFTGLRSINWLNTYKDRFFADAKLSGLPFSIVYMDLNHLGLMNEQITDDTVNEMLQEIGKYMTTEGIGFRGSDVSLHLYGDTFLVLMQATSSKQAYRALFNKLSALKDLGRKYVLEPSFSVGISEGNNFGSFREAFQAADDALTHAKRNYRSGQIPIVIHQKDMARVSYKNHVIRG